MSYNKLTKLNLSKNKKLKILDIQVNKFSDLNNKSFKLPKNCVLEELCLDSIKKMKTLDVSNLKKLKYLRVLGCPKLKKIKMEKNVKELEVGTSSYIKPAMKEISSKTIVVPKESKLTKLKLWGGSFTRIDCSMFKNLKRFVSVNDKPIYVDFSKNKKLSYIEFEGGKNKKLKEMYVSKKLDNSIKSYLKKYAKSSGTKISWH